MQGKIIDIVELMVRYEGKSDGERNIARNHLKKMIVTMTVYYLCVLGCARAHTQSVYHLNSYKPSLS
jgi:hypothetical protein